jgi:hypothetical protein
MGKHGTPWRRKGRGWYVTWQGRQVKLADEGEPKRAATEALERLRRGQGPGGRLAPVL